MQVLSRWRLEKDKKDGRNKIADTAETEKDEIADTAMSSPRLQDNTAKTRFTERFTANTVYREPRDSYEFTESQETVTCTETVQFTESQETVHVQRLYEFTMQHSIDISPILLSIDISPILLDHQSASHHGSTKVNCQRQVR